MSKAPAAGSAATSAAESYLHDTTATLRPEVGLQQEFMKSRRPAREYCYDSSLDPALSWDENPGREQAEWLLGLIERCAIEGEAAVFASEQASADGRICVGNLAACVARLKDLSKPFLNWTGKAERAEIKVPTLPLFIHERHSTKAIIDGLSSYKSKGRTLELFGDPQLDLTDKLQAYEHKGPWTNRMILGDSLVVMNSLLEYEGLGGQVQMIYIDPPYGVKFGSNFQPFVRKRDVKHGADEQMTREPEMVRAYRDTWELGLHSYLTYLRDRLLLARELLTESGSVFVQISDDNLHHVRELMDEVYGASNFVAVITFSKTSSATSQLIASTVDYLLWFAKDKEKVKYRPLYLKKELGGDGATAYTRVHLSDGTKRAMTLDEKSEPSRLPEGARVYSLGDMTSQRPPGTFPVELAGRTFVPKRGYWKTGEDGMASLKKAGRLEIAGDTLRYVRYFNDFPYYPFANLWEDTGIAGFTSDKLYVVQTSPKVIQRCVLMTTDPGDLVLDPTCGSGTTAYVAEQWGRRWITADTSRVPLALARQRLLTATFPYYDLLDVKIGPRGGFVYKRKRNKKEEEVGGLVPHITLKSIANNEEPAMEVLVDRPEVAKNITRVTGPFTVEALMPAAVEIATQGEATPENAATEPGAAYGEGNDSGSHIDRMLRVLKLSRTLRLPENRVLVFDQVRAIDGFETLHAEAEEQNGSDKRVAVVFGPEDGAIGSETVYLAAEEAKDAGYAKLYFFGFAIQAKAREMLEDRSRKKLPCSFITVTPDVLMSDLLKTTRASEIFSVTGLPDVDVIELAQPSPSGAKLFRVRLKGLDIFNPATLETEAVEGENLPCWMLDTDYDGFSFFATQVFFPKTSAWDNLQKSLKAQFEAEVWAHLSGTESEPFELGSKRRIAVKVIDERGNELMVVRDLTPSRAAGGKA
ncbi:adenine-specific DNA-methyltransferase [Aromatoleum tolulyticum]|uniref:site-specific DNA-methyltransferase (adenine-specific) n=1 Tax=Aromatoleum tolulyticum TaxID=34027 RepID=A0A1N6VV71_9RHOO|nr:site-specific DNA-methyltransferase [Aromatoleum tolulyticum]SIQ81655.1 adenine-specific DNA-methyltransferase [Aromatoleum tolulyticum]